MIPIRNYIGIASWEPCGLRAFVGTEHRRHPFHVVKTLFLYRKARYKGLAENHVHLFMLFGLANLAIAELSLLGIQARGVS